jgi:hypothetical protein
VGALALQNIPSGASQFIWLLCRLYSVFFFSFSDQEGKKERKKVEIRTRFSKSHPGLLAPGAPRAKPASIMAMRNFLFSQLVSVTWAGCCREKQDVGGGLTYMLKDGRRWFSTR